MMISEFAKDKVFWTRKMNLRLVEFMRQRPETWRRCGRVRSELRERAYVDFAAAYANRFTGAAVKNRWINIRTTFAYHLRKLKSKADQDEDYKVSWHLWDACQFLQNATKDATEDDIEESDVLNDNEVYSDVKDDALDSDNPEDINNFVEFAQPSSSNCTDLAKQLLKVFKGVQNDVFGVHNSKYAKIGRTIAKKLSTMNSFEAARLSQQIMEILLLYDDNNPSNPNNAVS